MPEQTVTGVLIISFDPEGTEQIFDIPDNGIRLFVFNQTFLNIHHIMRILLIHPRNNLPLSRTVKCRLYLMPVMQWLFHSHNGIHLPKGLHEFFHICLFFRQLLLVGDSLIITAAAFFGVWTCLTVFLFVLHNLSLIFSLFAHALHEAIGAILIIHHILQKFILKSIYPPNVEGAPLHRPVCAVVPPVR